MQTLKLSSKGEAVKQLQEKLGLIADGIFGLKTEDAVKKFLKEHNLTADGIVGELTWKALGIKDTNSKVLADFVVYSPLNTHISKTTDKKIKYIVLHYTAGKSSAPGEALKTKNVFTKREASADFVVDDTTIVLLNPDLSKYYTWHCGDKKNIYSKGGSLNGKCFNKNSIGIEICSNLKPNTSKDSANHEGWFYTDKELDNVVLLVKTLAKKYNIPKENIVRHYDVTGKLCPGIIGYNDEAIYDVNGNKTSKKSDSKLWKNLHNRF